jgi:hypothetical protein
MMKVFGYYIVKSRENGFLHVYMSRNGTPWHESRISIIGGAKYNAYYLCAYGVPWPQDGNATAQRAFAEADCCASAGGES